MEKKYCRTRPFKPALQCLLRCLRNLLSMVGIFFVCPVPAANLSLSSIPLFVSKHADPNVLLNLSVEGPTGGPAYNDQASSTCSGRFAEKLSGDTTTETFGACYSATVEYLGFFNPNRCYSYSASGYFEQAGAATNHACSGTWSGNMLNWATMTAVDEFAHVMTGGDRVSDTTAETVIERAMATEGHFPPYKLIRASSNVAAATVAPVSVDPLVIYNTGFGFQIGETVSAAKTSSAGNTFIVRVKACDTASSAVLDDNCVAYSSGGKSYSKPEGLIQKNASNMRYAVTSYSLDNDNDRDGGVLRSKMKYVGPVRPTTSGATEANPNKEYGNDGILIKNPDSAVGGLNSGVINYVNKFSKSINATTRAYQGYKSSDPVGELFYESLRYLKHLGRTPEYADGLTSDEMGGFQVITDWDDPMQYSCQKNYIIGLNDANPWLDKRLPGTYFTSATITGAGGVSYTLDGSDYGEPSNADKSIDVRTLTNTVGSYEGLNGKTWTGSGTWTSAGANGSISGVNDSIGGGIGTFDNSCSDKVVDNLGEVMGTCPSPQKQNSYYIAGLAYYGNTNDLRSDLPGVQTVSTFMIDTQEHKDNPLDGPRNMLWLAGKYGGFTDSNGNNRPDLPTEWDGDGDGSPDNYVLASSADKLRAGLANAFNDVFRREASAAAVALNTGSLQASSKLYQASFKSGEWTGEINAYNINSNGVITTTPDWSAAAGIDALNYSSDRRIATYRKGSKQGIPFRWPANSASPSATELESWQTTALNISPVSGLGDSLGSTRLDYLRGKAVDGFRVRAHVLGDIVDSSPAYVGTPDSRYSDNWGTGAPESASGSEYSKFVSSRASRTPMVYVGANDGMLHAIRAADGKELYAYVPSKVFKNLSKLTNQNYAHGYYVDGSPVVRDAYFNGAWHTVLLGSLRGGGQSIFALDITDVPATTDTETTVAAKVLWEFNDDYDDNSTNKVEGQDLGYTFGDPSIVRMHNGAWVAIFGNGYNNPETDGSASETGNAVLYIVNLQTGALIAKIDTGVGMTADPLASSRPNGLSSPSPADLNRDRIVDYIYAGDLFGNLWKFDVTSSNPVDWAVAYTSGGKPQPLFVAKSSSGAGQPITTRPRIGFHPTIAGTLMVYFGTGKYLETTDTATSGETTQTFYGIWDKNETALTSFSRTDLLQQTILAEAENTVTLSNNATDTFNVRVTSDNSITWSGTGAKLGWYLDLVNTGVTPQDNKAERVVADAVLRAGRLVFTTLVPSADPCDFGGTSWLMELDAASGMRLDYTTFDLDNNNVFNSADNVTTKVAGKDQNVIVSGKLSKVGIIGKPTIVTSSEKNKAIDIQSASGTKTCSSGVDCFTNVGRENDGPEYIGRTSWRELQTQ